MATSPATRSTARSASRSASGVHLLRAQPRAGVAQLFARAPQPIHQLAPPRPRASASRGSWRSRARRRAASRDRRASASRSSAAARASSRARALVVELLHDRLEALVLAREEALGALDHRARHAEAPRHGERARAARARRSRARRSGVIVARSKPDAGVDEARVGERERLQPLVVRRRGDGAAARAEAVEHARRERLALARIGAARELVEQDERAARRSPAGSPRGSTRAR